MEIVVRQATPDDLLQIGRLWRELTEWHSSLQPQRPFRPDAWDFRRCDFERAMSFPETNRIFLATVDGLAIGILWCEIRDAAPNPRRQPSRHAEVEVLVVSEPARGRGVGEWMMEACREWLEENGVTRTVLKVIAENDGARRFYERFGFRAVNVVMERSG